MDQPQTGRRGVSASEIVVQSKKIILGPEEGNTPDLGPLFVNNAEILAVGTDFYVDLGIIRPEDITAAGSSQQPRESAAEPTPVKLDFFVLQRIAMSEFTFRLFIQRGQEIVSHMDTKKERASEPSVEQ